MKTHSMVFVLLLLIIVSQAAAFRGTSETRAFESRLYGFSLRYPRDWHHVNQAGGIRIDSFPLSKWVTGVGLPPGGASVVIETDKGADRREASGSLEDWVKKGVGHQLVLGKRTFQLESDGELIEVVAATATCCGSPPLLEYTEWFFRLDGHFFQASLIRWQDDPGAEELREIMRKIVLSLRVTQH